MTDLAFRTELAFLPDGWQRDVCLTVGRDGNLSGVTRGEQRADAVALDGPVVPGVPNLHSHAFQRAMAGLTERAGPSEDSFWTWREVMYSFVDRLRPEHLRAMAAQLYVEMLKAGYTAVGEFHYLHHQPDGRPYDDLAEMSRQILEAARETGIGLTHLPVLYGFGGFGGQAANDGQRRFLNDPDRFLELLAAVKDEIGGDPQCALGIAPHSLRAVTPETLAEAIEGLRSLLPNAPIHIHVAEQTKEVDDCLAWSGRRPVAWLLDEQDLDEHWCLIHATHIDERECEGLARSGAVAGLCPATEANLGDGLFPAVDFLKQGGVFGIGSDSHNSVSPIEELRWLEYGQRLVRRRRNLLGGNAERPSVGRALFEQALHGGARALGRPIGRLETGYRADFLVLDPGCPTLIGHDAETLLDAMIFAGNENPVRDVMVGGRWVVRDRQHQAEDEILSRYRRTIEELRG